MKVYKLIPQLKKKRHLALWHKAQESQWSANSIRWDAPQRLTQKKLKDQLSRVLTPVLMGEQSAFVSASALLPLLGAKNEAESQYYLATWLVDEARHAELFTRMFERIDREPMSTRKFPSAYLFQGQVMANDAAVWLAGLLVVEVLAKKVMQEFVRLDLDPALSQISEGILGDEARHLGFNRVYIEDRMAELQRESPEKAAAFTDHLHSRLERVLEYAPTMFDALRTELREMGFDTASVLDTLGEESRARLKKAVDSGLRMAETEGQPAPTP
ncbi:MAG: ferritin-like domain-containing protein [Planctomycetota bacterium]